VNNGFDNISEVSFTQQESFVQQLLRQYVLHRFVVVHAAVTMPLMTDPFGLQSGLYCLQDVVMTKVLVSWSLRDKNAVGVGCEMKSFAQVMRYSSIGLGKYCSRGLGFPNKVLLLT